MINLLKRIVLDFIKLFEIDRRSLALFRICMGIVIIKDLIIRATSLIAHYTDYGVLARDTFFAQYSYQKWYYSIYHLSGEPKIIALLFIIAGVLAVGYTLGYKTKACAVLSFIFLISIQNRNPEILHGGDNYIRVLLFWSLFLPLNSKWSIDNWKANKSLEKNSSFVSFGSFSIILQIVSLYFFTSLFKSHPIWSEDFTAIYYALSLDQFASPFGIELVKYHNITKTLTALTFYLERFGMFLFFIPFFTQQFRFMGVVIFIVFHMIGINLTMELGIFQYVCSAAILLFLPAWFWDKLIVNLSNSFNRFPFITRIRDYKKKAFVSLEKLILPNKTAKFSVTPFRQNIQLMYKYFMHWSSQSVVLILGIYILLWNLREFDTSFAKYLPYKYNWIGRVLRIDQRWDLFAPYPIMDDGWFVVPASLSDGTQIDLFRNGSSVDYSKPNCISAEFKDERWQKYMGNLWTYNDSIPRKEYLDHLYQNWTKDNNSALEINKIELVYMLESTPLMGEVNNAPKKKILLEKRYKTNKK